MAQPVNLLQCPEPVETAELHFKLHCKVKVFSNDTKYGGGHCSILAVSQYYGLVFVGNTVGFSVISTKALTAGISGDELPRKLVFLGSNPTHLSVDVSQKVLVAACNPNGGPVLLFYNIQAFGGKDAEKPFKVLPLSKLVPNSKAQLVDLLWQPNADGSFVVCLSDGSVLALPQGTKNDFMLALPSTTQATCFCWSPKGKQIVIGTATGTLSQYKPDLKLVKTLPCPPLYNGAVVVVSVLWISNFQFAVAYNDRSNPEMFPVITIVNAAKNEPVSVINYDDVTYSGTLFRNHQIYMAHQPAWNLIFVSSANSIETAVLHMKDAASWEQWLLGDASRAELPLDPDRQETFPLGWAFDYTSGESIPWGEGSLPPMPRLLLVSDEGLLCVFTVVNAAAGAPQLCTPPQEVLDQSQFQVPSWNTPRVPGAPQPPPAATVVSTPGEAAKGILGSPPNPAAVKPTFTFQSSPGFEGFATKTQTKPAQDGAVSAQVQPEQAQVQTQQQPLPQPPVQAQQIQPQVQPLTQPAPPTTAHNPPNEPIKTPKMIEFELFTNAVFPPKPPGAMVVQPTSGPFGLQLSSSQKTLFAGKPPPQSTPFKPAAAPAEKPAAVPPVKKPEEARPRAEEAPGKGESPELTAVDDSVYLNALQEEVDHFNSELQQLSARVGKLDVQLGTEADKARMKASIEGLQRFWKEVKETTEAQSGEIHAVVMDLMEAFAWLENAKSRNLQRKNPSYIELKKSEELDPLNARHMSEISHLKYYIENQLKQLTGYLEKEWMDHQENYRNEIKSKMAVPPLEEVYKTMHYQLKILQKQKGLLEELKEKIAAKKRKNKSAANFLISSAATIQSDANGNRVSELSKLAENLLQLKINREEDSLQPGHRELIKSRLAAISDRSKKLTRDKQTALRDALSERDMVRIRPVKTTLEASSFLRSMHLQKTAAKSPKPARVDTAPVAPAGPPQLPPKASADVTGTSKHETPPVVAEPEKAMSAPLEKTTFSLGAQSVPSAEDKSPLNSLLRIVSNIKTNENEGATFKFGSPGLQKTEPSKEVVAFGPTKPVQKPEEPKAPQPFTFGGTKPGESIFGKKDPIVFGAKPTFNLPSSISIVLTKPEVSKPTPAPPNITIAPVTAAAAAAPSPFSFSAATSTPAPASFTFTASTAAPPASTPLPKVSLFATADGTSTFGTPAATTASLFASSVPLFGGAKTTATTFTTSTPLFGGPKATETTTSGFTFNLPEQKPAFEAIPTPIKSTPETEDVDVVEVEEPNKSEAPPEEPKDPPKAVVAPSVLSPPPSTKTPSAEVTSTPQASAPVSTPQTPTTIVFPKSLTVTVTPSSEASSSSSAAPPPVTGTTSTPATTSSVFSFSSVTSPIFFSQTTTTTTITTTAPLFGTPTSTPAPFPQVSSTTPTASIFGGATPASPSNIFGGQTPVKAATNQPSTPSKTSENIFASPTPTTTAFPAPSTPSVASVFGKQNDVDTTVNLFGNLLSDKPLFGTPSSTPNTSNLFSSKSIFESATPAPAPAPATTTTSSVFSSSFGSSLFGQPTTTTATVFGQPQTTSTSTSFFGQTSFTGFGKGTPVTSAQAAFKSSTGFSEPIFGSSLFGQGFKTNTPAFGTSSGSIFGGTPSSTTTNVFQTPTTSTTFGSTTPGPFSGGTSTFGETAFGSPPTFQKPLGGFGSPPVFGGSPPAPAFGGSPTFGGSHSFGSLPTFGSVSQGAFGQTSGSTTFENLANQNTVGFGNLAQQSQSQGFGGGFGSPTFENKSAFGGNSFSSWRSK